MIQKILVCDHLGVLESPHEIINSPVDCLDKAITYSYDLIVISFYGINMESRYLYIDLCSALREHDLPVLVVMDVPHREILSELQDKGVLFYETLTREDNGNYRLDISLLPTFKNLSAVLNQFCPMLHYIHYDYEERILCGMCNDKLVLGKQQQREICSSEEHLNCSFFTKERGCSC